ncbi:MAG: UpxY family transcription antiterminator [Bacteroidetes bacterium]|nr:UpxY family transcription antiterminator [Bacteroidota bacterium]
MGVERKWYALYTKPRWEKKVYSLLSEKHIESYCPLNKVTRKWSDRMKTIEEPLFKSYVFVRINDELQSQVRMTPGVMNFVYWQGKPAVVKDKEIDVIRKFLNEYDNVIAQPMDLKPESKVKIQQGIFMDKEARILKVQGNKVQVVIESIGYSLIAFIEKSNVVLTKK